MDLDKLLGANVETCLGHEIGEVVGIELLGPRVTIIIASDYDFTVGGPDGDGGISNEQPIIMDLGNFSVENDDNVVDFVKRGSNA